MEISRIAIFASGSGTNAQNIIQYFSEKEHIVVDSVWTNNADAFVVERARKLGIDTIVFTREELRNTDKIVDELRKRGVNLIVLAGFLLLIPDNLIHSFRIVNIHPALLPKYGGKGMYGMNVHKAVVENHEKESGISIHFVNDKYDEGTIIFQTKCEVLPTDSPQDVAEKVHQLEYEYYPRVIEQVILGK